MRKGLLIGSAVVLGVLLLVAVALLVVAGTDFGRERVRRFAVSALNDAVNGTVHIGAIEGNLLGGVTIRDVVIVDSAGAPFLSLERASVEYHLRDLLAKRIYLHDVTVVRPIVVHRDRIAPALGKQGHSAPPVQGPPRGMTSMCVVPVARALQPRPECHRPRDQRDHP